MSEFQTEFQRALQEGDTMEFQMKQVNLESKSLQSEGYMRWSFQHVTQDGESLRFILKLVIIEYRIIVSTF